MASEYEHMSRLILLLISVVFMTLISCTSEPPSYEVEALKLGQQRFEMQVREDAGKYINNSMGLRDAYVEFVLKRSQLKVVKNKSSTDLSVVADVMVEGYSPAIRQVLAEIAGSVPPAKAGQFNFSEALIVMGKKLGVQIKPQTYSFKTYKFNKTSAGNWVPEF